MYFRERFGWSMLYSRRARQREEIAAVGALFMKSLRIVLSLAALLVPVAAGCGGGGDDDVPSDAVAVVGERDIPKSEFDGLLNQAKRSYEAQKRKFPKAGTTEYNTLKNQAVQFLVQRAQFEIQADELEVEVTDKKVEDRLAQIKKQYFAGNQKRYESQLKQQGLTDAQVRKDIRAQLVQEGLFKKVTDKVKITDKEIQAYYEKNRSQYGQPESREVRHILVSTKKQADSLYARIKGGEDFGKLAKEFSKDPGSKDQGGKLTVARGQTVPPFDKAAFRLEKGALSQPVKTQYGYHLIEPLSAIKPAKSTPLKEVKDSIRQQLLQTKRNEAMTKWVEDTKEEFCDGKLTYQVGFKPNPDPCTKPVTTSTREG
jgi:peptidyl-prolyl cis-trans isomerase C